MLNLLASFVRFFKNAGAGIGNGAGPGAGIMYCKIVAASFRFLREQKPWHNSEIMQNSLNRRSFTTTKNVKILQKY